VRVDTLSPSVALAAFETQTSPRTLPTKRSLRWSIRDQLRGIVSLDKLRSKLEPIHRSHDQTTLFKLPSASPSDLSWENLRTSGRSDVLERSDLRGLTWLEMQPPG
jgi:hypothetical protein